MEVFAFSITALKIESDHGGPESTTWSMSVVKHSSCVHNATTYLMERGAVAITNNLFGRRCEDDDVSSPIDDDDDDDDSSVPL